MEAVVQRRVGFLAYSSPKQGQDFKPSAAPLYPNMGQVPSPWALSRQNQHFFSFFFFASYYYNPQDDDDNDHIYDFY